MTPEPHPLRCETCDFFLGREWADSTCLIRYNKVKCKKKGHVFHNDDCASHSDVVSAEQVFISSSNLLLVAHDEWKRREERKYIHDENSWVHGFISGYLTSKKFVKDVVGKLQQREREQG